jgi:hypothetical protein
MPPQAVHQDATIHEDVQILILTTEALLDVIFCSHLKQIFEERYYHKSMNVRQNLYIVIPYVVLGELRLEKKIPIEADQFLKRRVKELIIFEVTKARNGLIHLQKWDETVAKRPARTYEEQIRNCCKYFVRRFKSRSIPNRKVYLMKFGRDVRIKEVNYKNIQVPSDPNHFLSTLYVLPTLEDPTKDNS